MTYRKPLDVSALVWEDMAEQGMRVLERRTTGIEERLLNGSLQNHQSIPIKFGAPRFAIFDSRLYREDEFSCMLSSSRIDQLEPP